MGWLAIVAGAITLLTEIFQLIREMRTENKEEAVELKKQKTEIIQSIARGLIDGDEHRVNSGFDRLRGFRK